MTSHYNFSDMKWIPTMIMQYPKHETDKQCIIGIPIYKEILSDSEKASFIQICNVIQNSYEICLICPDNLKLDFYISIANLFNINLSVLPCNELYFKSTATYSYLCETADFYKCFKDYEYLLIYQLDGWIFENDLQKYIDLNVDYIGSPWKLGSFQFNQDTIGNGGISLRRISKFISICENFKPEDFKKNYVDKEDLFFCKTFRYKTNFKYPKISEASQFSITAFPRYFIYNYNQGKLPMCVHAWEKESQFWAKYININDVLNLVPTLLNVPKTKIQNLEEKIIKHKKIQYQLIQQEQKWEQENQQAQQEQEAKMEKMKKEKQKQLNDQYNQMMLEYYNIKVPKEKHQEPKEVKYQEKTSDSVIKYYQNNDILICIFNYKKDDNARRWLHALSPYFDTYVLDSGNDKTNDDFIQFPNIYYSGLFNEFKKLFSKKKYKWGGIICSDVTITDENLNKFIDRVKWLNTTSNVGIWQAAADETSRSIHGTVTKDESIQYKLWIEGWLIFMRHDIIDETPYITPDNVYGWNIDTVSEIIAYNKNLLAIIDNNCIVHHPAERGYPESPARQQGREWEKATLNKLKLQKPRNSDLRKFPINFVHTNDVTFIMINRGGKHVNKVINNFTNTFSQYFRDIKFIIVQQDDLTPFKRGQLINIGVKFSNTEYIGIIDNDIINVNNFNPVAIYNKFKHGFVAFNKIVQLDENENKIAEPELRLSGFGAFNFMKREDFINVNGETNLCSGWGLEDNIFNLKYSFERYENTLGHIYHKKRLDETPKLTQFNKGIFKKYQDKLILSQYDGYNQMFFDIKSIDENKNIAYINVNNVSVIKDYQYMNLYNQMKTIENQYLLKEPVQNSENSNIKLYGMTLVYNEETMIPYVMPYYERMGFDKLIIYDNESTDRTAQLLKQYSFVEVRTFKTQGKNNRIQSELKDNFFAEFKGQKNTWLYISDFDEVVYYHGDFKEYLQKQSDDGYTYMNQTMFELFNDKFPELSNKELIHEKCKLGNMWNDITGGAKLTLFRADKIDSLKFSPGAHNATVITHFKQKSLNGKEIKSFHIKYVDYDFCLNKMKRAQLRRSEEDKRKQYGTQYENLSKVDKFNKEWNKRKTFAIPISQYLNNDIKSTEQYEKTKLHWEYI